MCICLFQENPFTKEFCSKLSIVDPVSLLVSNEDMMMNASNTFEEGDYLDDHESQMDITLNKTSATDVSKTKNIHISILLVFNLKALHISLV